MKIETKLIWYDILLSDSLGYCERRWSVKGRAVNSPSGVRYCLRWNMVEGWVIDDFDTGCKMNSALPAKYGLLLGSIEHAIEVFEETLPGLLDSGKYDEAGEIEDIPKDLRIKEFPHA